MTEKVVVEDKPDPKEKEKPFKLLSKADILSVNDVDYVDVYIPQWKGFVRLRSLNADESIKFTDLVNDQKVGKQAVVRIMQISAVDENGSQLFTSTDLEALKSKSFVVFRQLQDAALELNGFGNPIQFDVKCNDCDFYAATEAAARSHAEKTQHTLAVSGTIYSSAESQKQKELGRKNASGGTVNAGSPSAWQ